MKKYYIFIGLVLFLCPFLVSAQRGCCSHHGGVAGCTNSGNQLCRDGTLSPSCTCTPTIIIVKGCTDSKAINYNCQANQNDNSCQYKNISKQIEEIPYQTIYEENNSLNSSEQIVKVAGIKGKKEITYEIITDVNNKEISKQVINSIITKSQVDEVIQRNTNQNQAENTLATMNDSNSDNKNNSNLSGFVCLGIILGSIGLLIKKHLKK
jgi:hypothetical protein